MKKIDLMKEDGELIKFLNGNGDSKDLELPLDIKVLEFK